MVASDIGNTLSTGKKPVSRFTAAVFDRLTETGVPVALVTGYNLQATQKYLVFFQSSPFLIIQNGTLCMQGDRIVWEYRLEAETAGQVGEVFAQRGVPVVVYRDSSTDFALEAVACPGSGIDPMFRRVKNITDFTSVSGVSTYAENVCIPGLLKEIEKKTRGIDSQTILSRGKTHSWIEVTPGRARKDLAIERLCARYALGWQDVMYFGDNRNDLEVLKKAGFPRVVANALPELLEFFGPPVAGAGQEGPAKEITQVFGFLNIL